MKKILCFVFVVLFSFCFCNKIDASYCLYSSADGSVNYYTMDVNNAVWVANMETGNVITSSNLTKVAKTDSEKERKLTSQDKCFKYMFYSTKTSGKVYFSHELDAEVPKDFTKIVFLKGPYTGETNANAKLNKMVCSYAGTIDKNQLYWTINFVIDENGYTVYGNGKELYSNMTGKNSYDEYMLEDNYDIRLFRSSDSKYACPDGIFLEYGKTIGLFKDEYHTILKYNGVIEEYPNLKDRLTGQTTGTNYLSLQKSASYIVSEEISGNIGSDCLYSRTDNTNSWDLGIHSITYTNGDVNYVITHNTENNTVSINNVIYKFDSNDYFSNSCSLDKIYTTCLTSKTGTCVVSDKPFNTLQTSEGIVETLVSNADRNDKYFEDAQEGVSEISGYKYKELMCKLSKKLESVPNALTQLTTANDANSRLLFYNDSISNVDGEYLINNLPCTSWGFNNYDFNCSTSDCKSNIGYIVQSNVMDILNYCRSISSNDNESIEARRSECVDFYDFYNQLVKYGIISNLTKGCDILSTDIQEKLTWILDIIKIAGPILALGLGTLDFIKAIASGDADKEMKTAFKRFTTRIIAAALLFVIPVILAFMMDIFLGNQDGYNEDNPFCNIVEWND